MFFSMYMDIKSTIIDQNKINDTEQTNFVFRICSILVSIFLISVGVINATRKTKILMTCVESVRKVCTNYSYHDVCDLCFRL